MREDITRFQNDVETFLTATEEARELSERDRAYVDHEQWTQEEADDLAARRQPPVVINRLRRKVDTICGIQKRTRTDPRALPRTPQHEEEADTCTAALRYVADNVDFDDTSSGVFFDTLVWGYGGVIVEWEDEEIHVNRIQADRLYFDPYSRELDFTDAGYLGIQLWMDKEDAQAMFPEHADKLAGVFHDEYDIGGDTFQDRPTWIDRERGRIRICQHYYRKGKDWWWTYFTGHMFLMEPEPSPCLDENGRPCCPIKAQSAYCNIDNERYGLVRGDIWIQDEINHRRSKLLYNVSVRQTMAEQGAIDDVNELKRQLSRADGHVNYNKGFEFQIIPKDAENQTQFALYQESKGEIDQIGMASVANIDEKTLSGRAIQALQQGGMTEMTGLFDGHKHFERRVYRAVWNLIRQYWQGQKWIRVSDSEDSLKWVAMNQPITNGEALQELAQNGDEVAAMTLQQMIVMQDPRLNEVYQVRNNVAELDVDIVISETPDFATQRQEQFEALAQLAQAYGPQAVPFRVMLELADIPNKAYIKEMLGTEPSDEQKAAMAQEEAEMRILQKRGMVAEIATKEADAQKKAAEVQETLANTGLMVKKAELTNEEIDQKAVETIRLTEAPPESVSVSV